MVTIYTKTWCPYCMAAKDLLEQKGIAFASISSRNSGFPVISISAKAKGRSSVPQIFIGERHVGGCDDLYALDRKGELDKLLALA